MQTTTALSALSADGTRIAFDRVGDGTPLILVEAAGHYRDLSSFDGLVPLLAQNFTVYRYDRRGRGQVGTRCRTRRNARSRTSRPWSRRQEGRRSSTATHPGRCSRSRQSLLDYRSLGLRSWNRPCGMTTLLRRIR
jgi:pimeloyl-ACP methyl ester carboxylesterase